MTLSLSALRQPWPRGAGFLFGIWVLVPILGNIVPFLYLIGSPFLRDRDPDMRPPMRPELKVFTALCFAYVGYILGRGFFAGNLASLQEPAEDALPIIITALVGLWVVRSRSALPLAPAFKIMIIAQIVFFGWAGYVHFVQGIGRPPMASGNLFNWAPLLIVPALLCTDSRLAPDRLWHILGLVAFTASAYNIIAISESRGLFIALSLGVGARAVSELAISGPKWRRIRNAVILVTLYLTVLESSSFSSGFFSRFVSPPAQASISEPRSSSPITPVVSIDYGMSLFVRGAMMQSGWNAFLEAPVFGHGPQHRFTAAAPYFPPEFIWDYSHLHNDFVTHAVAGGTIAVLLLVLLLAFPTLIAWRYPTHKALRREIGLLFSLSFALIALFNNVLFVAIWGFMLPLNMMIAFLLVDSIGDNEL